MALSVILLSFFCNNSQFNCFTAGGAICKSVKLLSLLICFEGLEIINLLHFKHETLHNIKQIALRDMKMSNVHSSLRMKSSKWSIILRLRIWNISSGNVVTSTWKRISTKDNYNCCILNNKIFQKGEFCFGI